MKSAEVLTGYAWGFRYPGEGYLPDSAEAETMYALAARVLDQIRVRLVL